MLSRGYGQQVVSQHEFDRQQVLKHAQRHVGLACSQRRSSAVVLNAEVQRRYIKRCRPGELLELGE
jgi:hypothetical protein